MGRFSDGIISNISVNLVRIWLKRRYRLEILIYSFAQPFCSAGWAELDHLCNFDSGHYENYFREIILNLNEWFRRRCSFKIFLIYSPGGHCVQRGEPIGAIFVESIMRNISEIILNWDQLFRN